MAWCAACPTVLAQSHGEQRQPQELRCESEPQGRRPWQARGGSRRCASACEAERNRAKLREEGGGGGEMETTGEEMETTGDVEASTGDVEETKGTNRE